MIVRAFLASGVVALGYGCATVPDDAPAEFHSAEKAIQEMEEQDAEEELPETAERAEDRFEDALDLLDDAEDGEEGVTQAEAVQKASEAEQLARDATEASNAIRRWDESGSALQDALARLDQPQEQVAQNNEPTSPFAMLSGVELVSTVAYFKTNQADSPRINEGEMDALVSLLEKSDQAKVTLKGHADARGTEEHNKQLAQNRAKTVAERLYEKGIDKNRVQVESMGEVQDTEGEMILDRNVKAVVSF